MSASRTRWQDFRGAISLRTAVLALCLGNAVQWYDFALYGAFATVIGAVFFPAQDPSVVMLAAFATYGIAVIIRPVGALIFGRMADIRGRRAVFLPIILLMAGATAAVGFLPGYATIGILAPIALIVLLLALPLALVARFVRRRVSETSGFLALQESGQVIKSPSRRFGLMIASP